MADQKHKQLEALKSQNEDLQLQLQQAAEHIEGLEDTNTKLLEEIASMKKSANEAAGTADENLAAYNKQASDAALKIAELQKENEEYAKTIEELEQKLDTVAIKKVSGTYKEKKFKDGYTALRYAGKLYKSEELMKAAAGTEVEGLTKEEAKRVLDALIAMDFGGFQ